MDLFLQAVFKQVQSTQNQSKFLQVLTMWNVRLGTELTFADIEDVFENLVSV